MDSPSGVNSVTYAWSSPADNNSMIVAIVSVDVAQRKAEGLNRYRSTVMIDLNYHVGAVLVTPAVGEQWYVERIENNEYTLLSKIPFNDPNILVDAQEGMVQVGSSGPLELGGSAVNANGPLRLAPTNGEMPAADAGAIVYSTTDNSPMYFDGTTWHSLANDAPPWDLLGLVIFQATTTRAVGTGDFPFGVSLPRSVRIDSVTYRVRTAASSGNLVIELRRNGVTVPGSSVSIPAASQVSGGTQTGPWSFLAGDILTVYVTGVGASPGQGLVADLRGVATRLVEAQASMPVVASRPVTAGPGADANLALTAIRPVVMLSSPVMNSNLVVTATETTILQQAGRIAASLPVSATASVDAVRTVAPLAISGTPATVNATSVALPTHAVGDMIIIAAAASSNTLALKPTAAGTVPVFTDITANTGANTTSMRIAYAIATTSSHTSGTWANAAFLAVIVVHNQNASPIGGAVESGGTSSSGVTAPAITMINTSGASFLLEFYYGGFSAWNAAPSGYTRRASTHTTSAGICLNTKNVTTSDGAIAQTGTWAGFTTGFRGATIEILH